jgi:hypothetical protein
MALQPFVGPWPLLQFRNLFYTDGRTPWMSDQTVAKPLPTHRQHRHRISAHTDIHALSGIRTHDPSLSWFLSSVIFFPWGRFRSNRMEITSFNSRILAFLTVTVFRPVRCGVNSIYLSVVMESFLYALPRNRRLCIQCIASWIIFVVAEILSPSRSLAMGAGSASTIATFRRHVTVRTMVRHSLRRKLYEKEVLFMSEFPTGVWIPEVNW